MLAHEVFLGRTLPRRPTVVVTREARAREGAALLTQVLETRFSFWVSFRIRLDAARQQLLIWDDFGYPVAIMPRRVVNFSIPMFE